MSREVHVIDGYRYVINTKTDDCIYLKNRTRPSGRDNWEGTDLYAHKAKNGKVIFYLYHWTRYQDGNSYTEITEKDEVEAFLARMTQEDEWGYPYDKADEDQLKEYGINIMEEGEVTNNVC